MRLDVFLITPQDNSIFGAKEGKNSSFAPACQQHSQTKDSVS